MHGNTTFNKHARDELFDKSDDEKKFARPSGNVRAAVPLHYGTKNNSMGAAHGRASSFLLKISRWHVGGMEGRNNFDYWQLSEIVLGTGNHRLHSSYSWRQGD